MGVEKKLNSGTIATTKPAEGHALQGPPQTGGLFIYGLAKITKVFTKLATSYQKQAQLLQSWLHNFACIRNICVYDSHF